MEDKKGNHIFQILMLGDPSVGKSAMVQRFNQGKFSETCASNESVTKDVVLKNGVHVKVQIWDTVEQEKLKELTKTFSQGTVSALLVYDVLRSETFNSCAKWMNEVKQYAKENNVSFVIVGNKTDCIPQIYIDTLNAVYFAEKNKMELFNCSALNGDNIDAVFKALIEEMYSKTEKNQGQSKNKH